MRAVLSLFFSVLDLNILAFESSPMHFLSQLQCDKAILEIFIVRIFLKFCPNNSSHCNFNQLVLCMFHCKLSKSSTLLMDVTQNYGIFCIIKILHWFYQRHFNFHYWYLASGQSLIIVLSPGQPYQMPLLASWLSLSWKFSTLLQISSSKIVKIVFYTNTYCFDKAPYSKLS